MNTVSHIGFINDSNKTRDAILRVNGNYFTANPLIVGYKDEQQTKPIVVWYCQASNDWNESNRIRFEARTLKKLVEKLEKHPYKLVK